ncbi:MAG: TIM barrel protein [Desulfovibrionaceae bacterium]|nr:TIM barrel protein [Desulfovibrionaceae bacterium]
MPKFAANLTMMFKEVDFLERFEAAAKCGFKAVEFLWPYAYDKNELAKILKDNGLEVALFNTTAGDTAAGEWGHAGLPGREAEAKAELEQALEYAIALNCHTVHVMSCVVPYPAEKEMCRQVFIKNMRWAADLFAKEGKVLTMEALCPDIKPRYLYHSQYETLALMEEIGKDNVFIQLDTFHAQMVDGNLTHLIRDFAGKYGHVQIAAAPSRHEPDEGEINYEYIFKLFDEVGYKGYIGCEYNPRGKTEDGLSWLTPYL